MPIFSFGKVSPFQFWFWQSFWFFPIYKSLYYTRNFVKIPFFQYQLSFFTLAKNISIVERNREGHSKNILLYYGVAYSDLAYLVFYKLSRILLSLNQKIEVKMFREAAVGVKIQLLFLLQIPLHIPSSTSLSYGIVSKLTCYETIPKMWNCGLISKFPICQILSSWDVFL